MKLRRTLLAGAAALALASQAGAGELRGSYASIEGGGSWVGSERFLQATAVASVITTSALYDTDFETGWAIFGTLGYAFSNNMRAELEVGYRNNDIETLRELAPAPGALSPEGDLSEFTVMANLLYDIPLGQRLTLSIGGGVGADQANFEVATLGLDDDEWVFAYQAIAGLSYRIGSQTQLFVNYRYLRADAPEYTATVAANTVQHTAFLDDLPKHTATLGLRFALGGGRAEPAPPPAAPPAPPPPPPPAAPPQFIVFFGLGSAELVPEAERVVRDAAGAARDFGAAAIRIVAHTDSAGSSASNQRLSERRALAVRAALAANGIPASAITTEGRGEDDLMVQTGDGVKEPQNRRATIDMK